MEWIFYYKEGEDVRRGILPDNSTGTLEHGGEKTLISQNPNKMNQFRKEMTNSYFHTLHFRWLVCVGEVNNK